jgi:hypothetical protein
MVEDGEDEEDEMAIKLAMITEAVDKLDKSRKDDKNIGIPETTEDEDAMTTTDYEERKRGRQADVT